MFYYKTVAKVQIICEIRKYKKKYSYLCIQKTKTKKK